MICPASPSSRESVLTQAILNHLAEIAAILDEHGSSGLEIVACCGDFTFKLDVKPSITTSQDDTP